MMKKIKTKTRFTIEKLGLKVTDQRRPKVLYLIDKTKKSNLFSFLTGKDDNVYENFYKQLVSIPESEPVDIVITTTGGPAVWCNKICYVLKHRSGKSRAFIKSFAHSAGTIIALTTDELFITYDTTFSSIDVQWSPLAEIFQSSLKDFSTILENPLQSYAKISKERSDYFRDVMKYYINDKHNKDSIVKFMHDESTFHGQLFFKENMNSIGIVYSLWNGNVDSLSSVNY
jgi:ClpP class serine protease